MNAEKGDGGCMKSRRPGSDISDIRIDRAWLGGAFRQSQPTPHEMRDRIDSATEKPHFAMEPGISLSRVGPIERLTDHQKRAALCEWTVLVG